MAKKNKLITLMGVRWLQGMYQNISKQVRGRVTVGWVSGSQQTRGCKFTKYLKNIFLELFSTSQ
jgi:hypothetical protein